VRLEGDHHIRVKESAGKEAFPVLDGVEAAHNLDILVPDQEFFDSAPGMSDRKGALYFLYTSAAADRFLGATFRVICK
jgi:hypothetical protein